MGNVHLPLSGAVNQAFEAWKTVFGQVSFFTVNVGRSSAPELEPAILRTASYGKQLGRMGEALLAVIDVLDADGARTYTRDQQEAIDAFRALMKDIDLAKQIARVTGP